MPTDRRLWLRAYGKNIVKGSVKCTAKNVCSNVACEEK